MCALVEPFTEIPATH